ncbi:MAG: DUF86 domain-containing protein [Nitrospirae bacterium]|nr:DUF86 domain-containing protein [Nitrospirota bacterium]MBF0591305.1 DUF86 domain-containing protein [Nitrospirota bacterium]
MTAPSLIPRLTDIVEAIERVCGSVEGMSFDTFEADWQRQWIVQRGVEIISEASRYLTDNMKDRHPEIPWRQVADIGNVLRHNYGNIAAPIIWKLVRDDLPSLEKACREELAAEIAREKEVN